MSPQLFGHAYRVTLDLGAGWLGQGALGGRWRREGEHSMMMRGGGQGGNAHSVIGAQRSDQPRKKKLRRSGPVDDHFL
jgi:hypothetical protein